MPRAEFGSAEDKRMTVVLMFAEAPLLRKPDKQEALRAQDKRQPKLCGYNSNDTE
jgi:hypothetical protein